MVCLILVMLLGLLAQDEMSLEFSAILTPESRLALSPEVAAALSPEAMAALSPEAAKMITPQIVAALSPQVAAALTPEIIAELTPEIIAALTPEKVAVLSPELVAAYTPEQISVLSPEIIIALTPETIMALVPDEISRYPPEALAKLAPEDANRVLRVLPSVRTTHAFTPFTYHYTGGRYKNEQFRYRLLIPKQLDRTKKYPLLVWLHGIGESGSDNMMHLVWLDGLIFRDQQYLENHPFFLLAIQCPSDNPQWFQSHANSAEDFVPDKDPSPKGDELLTITMEILDQTLQSYPIDENRVSLAGISSGGSGCWEMAIRYPDRFAAVAPMSSGGGDLSCIHKLVDVPIWAFHSADDESSPIDGARNTAAALEKAGGTVHLTETKSIGDTWTHDSWTPAFRDHELLFWLLSKRRGDPAWKNPPGSSGHRPWPWWQIVLESTLLAVFLLACGQEWKRRRSAYVKISAIE